MTPPAPPRTILITGATDGLGRALAHRLAAEGDTVLLHGRDQGRLDRTAEEIADQRARTELWERSLKLIGHAGI
ncbi:MULTISPECIES: SDR family NAD(P)-dependent oxidoreductase [Kitasatospora]|uniref:SDR family NAD(P)-dependent oxidoreductase n=1 Tax=Kitasatospora cathayae TaxID=3004092 RepID=UPI002FD82BED